MAFTIVKSSTNTVTITAGTNDLSVTLKLANNSYTLDTISDSSTILAGESSSITYDSDGIYVIFVTELAVTTKYIDLCMDMVNARLADDIQDLILVAVDECDYSSKRYDFVALFVLAMQYFGNTTYSLYVDATTWSTLPLALRKIQDAFARVGKYISLNNSTTQSTN